MKRHPECAQRCQYADLLGVSGSCDPECRYEAFFGVENDPTVGPPGAPSWFEPTLGDAD